MSCSRHMPRMHDLLITALEQEGLQARLTWRGPHINGVEVLTDDDSRMYITNPAGADLTYLVNEHTGLLINRYPHHDLSRWRHVHETACNDAFQDIQAAIPMIKAEVHRPLTDLDT
ncbi:hypothetical protein ABZ234_08050 [Nocardiopsis sp. NPDC006198]|uniref:hypothetical protein n=1 Tax=Nocardiopsis sp. NPDC006198 TaxID=3154472 RepID=UPI0033B12080